MHKKASVLAAVVILLCGLLPLRLVAAAPRLTEAAVISKLPHVEITGAYKTSPAGDVNGDGFDDVLITRGSLGDTETHGRAWVIFGSRNRSPVDLADIGDRGFLISGPKRGAYASEPTALGDVNGDGLDDIAIGAPHASSLGRTYSGIVYVIFGKTDNEPVSLRDFDLNLQGDRGYRIDGYLEHGLAGQSIAPAGDMNGDGLADVMVGAPFAGAAYVVFGKPGWWPVDLMKFHLGIQEQQGFLVRIPEISEYDRTYSVDGGGDVNGDSVPDVLIAVGPPVKKVYVIFGKSDTARVDAGDLGRGGYVLTGGGVFTSHAAFVGDVNGDGRDDIIAGTGHRTSVVRFAVAFGRKKASTIDLRNLGTRGFMIQEESPEARDDPGAKPSVAAAGDLDGDGLDDILIGAPGSSYNGRPRSGSVYVVYGKRSTRDISLAGLGSAGYRIDGPKSKAFFGKTPRSVGDFNGDGLLDLVTGASTLRTPGKSFVILGRR